MKTARIIFIAIIFIGLTVAVVWLSGFFFLGMTINKHAGGIHKVISQTDLTTWWVYWQAYHDQSRPIQKRLVISALAALLLCYGVPLLLLLSLLHQRRSLHGDARFANPAEIIRSGLLCDDGIVVGKWRKKFLVFSGSQFVLLSAPTRSGKGVALVIPNLLTWGKSVVCTDIKLENFLITSRFRTKHGQEVYLFNPFCLTEDMKGNPLVRRSHRYNPLGYISEDPMLRVSDILNISYAIYPDTGGKEKFFNDTARNLFLGLVLYLMETPGLPCTFGEVLRQSSGKGQPVKDYLQNIITERNYRKVDTIDNDTGGITQKLVPLASDEQNDDGLLPLSSTCVDALNRCINNAEGTLTSIIATFNAPLTLFASPVVDAATSANDFDLRDVRKKLMTIYLGVPANKLAEASLLLNLFYTQLINLNTNQLLHATTELKHECLLLLDEFTAPGRIGIIDTSNAFLAGYGLRMLTIVQSPGQIEALPPKGYGKDAARALMTNHACQILFTPREQRDAEEYSRMLGYETVQGTSKTRQHGGGSSGSESISDQRRALMMPQEIKELGQDQQIIILENTKPILCDKIRYHNDLVFQHRLQSVSATLAGQFPGRHKFEKIWGAGDLAAPVPVLDFDLHVAMTERRVRSLTIADTREGINLDALAVDTSALTSIPANADLTDEQINTHVNAFFDALDAANGFLDDQGDEDEGDGMIDLSVLEQPVHTELEVEG